VRLDPAAILERFLARPRVAYAVTVLDTYGKAPGGLLANGLAFSALFASIPTALVALGLAGWLADDPAIQAALAEALVAAFPPLEEVIDASLAALTQGAPITSIVGLVGLIWAVSQFYVTVDVAFSRVFTQTAERDIVGRTARGFLWVAIIVALVVVAIIAGALLTAAEGILETGRALGDGLVGIVTSVPVLIALAILLVGIVYRFVPSRNPVWSAVPVPAIAAGLAISVLTQLFAFLAPRIVGFASIVGPLATVFVALIWLSFSFQALLLGGAWVAVDDRRRRAVSESALAAPAAPTEPGGGGQ
jgi:YihY family inner membrane protein